MKYFQEEIQKFYDKLVHGEKFSFSKYADGEWMAMKNQYGSPGNGEWIIDDSTVFSRQLLIESFQFQDPGYFVGISCPCCQGSEHQKMKQFSGQPESQLTFANLFVNGNYEFFLNKFIPYFQTQKIVLVANRNTKLSELPIPIYTAFGIGYNSWYSDLELLITLQKTLHHYNDCLFLFSCGPLGNILAANLWKQNKMNTYIDIGSTIDKWANNDYKNKRCYASGVAGYSDKICIWGE